ncbi:hypothetical protein [Pseudomonas sp. NPDC089569]|uniref:hypothetical protein n=1 Tax=Pseudomonas sp. NPDC089569 TaxID=3390722 RepID=UPI003D067C2C
MRGDVEVVFVLTMGGLFFGLGFIFIFGQIYLALFKMKEIINCLSNSQGVLLRKSIMKNGGVFGVYFMLISVAAFLTFPSRAISSGELSEKDYINFPRGLLTLIKILYGAAFVGGGAALVLFVVGRYMGWVN